ncbi:MAG: iron-sulfur cluster assembly scaffold protein [Deltaproteobacteria bacterium]|nr:MAG: iron-sulfur cluster assembly scaffold protein [Deltaproteobacteria bacterium]
MEFLQQIPVWTILIAAGLLLLVIGAWLIVERLLNPTSAHPEDPDVTARITGVCGDTMEITLKVKDGMVISAGYWASGCGPSSACGAMATQLATGKSVDDIPEIVDHEAIEKAVGGLPEDKVHCAQLAADTLVEALHQYFIRQRKNTS